MAEFPCRLCARHILPEPDEATEKAQEIMGLLSHNLYPDQPPPWEFLFKLVGLTLPSALALEVYHRIRTMADVQQEYRQQTTPDARQGQTALPEEP